MVMELMFMHNDTKHHLSGHRRTNNSHEDTSIKLLFRCTSEQ